MFFFCETACSYYIRIRGRLYPEDWSRKILVEERTALTVGGPDPQIRARSGIQDTTDATLQLFEPVPARESLKFCVERSFRQGKLVLLIDDSPSKYSHYKVISVEKNYYFGVSSLPIGQDCQEIAGALDSWTRPRWEELQVILDTSQGGGSYSQRSSSKTSFSSFSMPTLDASSFSATVRSFF